MQPSDPQTEDWIGPASNGDLLGNRLGPYQMLRFLGQGGMGQVYLAQHQHLKRPVAVKVIVASRLNDDNSVSRFYREMEAVGALSHPNLVLATDAGCIDERHFLAMEYVDGANLSELVKQNGPMPAAAACEVVRQAAIGLEHAHSKGVVHRDIKPSNLMLTRVGAVKVLDLGLARVASSREVAPEGAELTLDSQIMGTPDFMSPEQAKDSRDVSEQSDIYSLGCTLFYLLTGRAPFDDADHDTAMKKVLAHQNESIPPLPQSCEQAAGGLRDVLNEMTSRSLAERSDSAQSVAERLSQFASLDELKDYAETRLPTRSKPQAERDTSEIQEATTNRNPAANENTAAEAVGPENPRSPATRYLAPAILLLLVASLLGFAAVRSALDSGDQTRVEPGEPSAPTANTSGNTAPSEPLATESLSFTVRHYRFTDDAAVELGRLGQETFAARVNDDVRVSIELKEPSYAYLVAINTDSSVQLCWPEDAASIPEISSQVELYPDPSDFFSLTEGEGAQCFLLIASESPLPSWNEWWDDTQSLPAVTGIRGVWRHQDGKLAADLPSAPVRGNKVQRGPKPLSTICEQLGQREGISFVEAITFPVVASPFR